MASSKAIRLASLLIDIEAELRTLQCWDDETPELARLQSPEPFCIDTLEFYQWLQWIFIPKVYHAIDHGLSLPERCSIRPIGEEWAISRSLSASTLLKILADVDEVLSEPNQGQ